MGNKMNKKCQQKLLIPFTSMKYFFNAYGVAKIFITKNR